MKSQLLIPNKIKVGFNLRKDTYTGKLGYVIYHDGKTWRKEPSWESWRQKEGQEVWDNIQDEKGKWKQTKTKLGHEINPVEFDNVPTDGFVLNRKAGGGSSGWNHRATYCRVYDPRGFEFEISIPNLLFILQETSSFKGKGLEGEFVYSWEGKDLVLIPTCCEDYQKSASFTKLQDGKIGVKDLVLGCSYKTKRQENLIYLGKFNWFEYHNSNNEITYNKNHIFVDSKGKFINLSSLTSLSVKISDTPIDNYAELVDKLLNSKNSGPIKNVSLVSCSVSFGDANSYSYCNQRLLNGVYYKKLENGSYRAYNIVQINKRPTNYGYYSSFVLEGYKITSDKVVSFSNDDFKIKSSSFKDDKLYSRKEIEEMGFKTLTFETNKDETLKLTV